MKQLITVGLLLALLCGLSAEAGSFKRKGADPEAETVAATEDSLAAPTGRSLVFLRSLVVPGWGESVMARSKPGLKHRGRLHFWLDVGLLASAWTLNRVGDIKREEYQSYAQDAAGASPHGDSSDYWVNVSNYMSLDEYNLAMLQTGRLSRVIGEEDRWEWQDRSAFIRYRDLRARSERAYSQVLAVSGAILINHLLSGVHALQLSRIPLEAAPTELGLGLSLPLDLQGAVGLR